MGARNDKQKELDELLMEKEFDQLSDEEKAQVIKEMTQEEYALQRSLLLRFYESQKGEHKHRPSEDVKISLMQSFLEPPKASLPRFVPLYWAAAVAALLFLAGTLIGQQIAPSIELPAEVKYIYHNDTVFLPEYIEKEVIVYKPVAEKTEEKATHEDTEEVDNIEGITKAEVQEPLYLSFNAPITPQKGKLGKSMTEDSLRFLFSPDLGVY